MSRTGNFELDLRDLRVIDALLREHSLTHAARAMNVTQPALSKTLHRLRRYFDDPLFVRVALTMQPTPKALELESSISAILEQMRALSRDQAGFDPASSTRTFKFCVVDAGMLKLLPPLFNALLERAPHARLEVLEVDLNQLEWWLASGKVDFAMGSFPSLAKGIRRQSLWVETYASVVRRGHPRIQGDPTLEQFTAEKHIVVSALGVGHAHQRAQRILEATLPPQNVVCRVPMFITAALLANHSDAIATIPRSTATALAADVDLTVFAPPLKLPAMEICQYWHQLVHRDGGNQWIRAQFAELFGVNSRGKVPAGSLVAAG